MAELLKLSLWVRTAFLLFVCVQVFAQLVTSVFICEALVQDKGRHKAKVASKQKFVRLYTAGPQQVCLS